MEEEGARVGMEVEGACVEGITVGIGVDGELGVFSRAWTRAWCSSFSLDSIDNNLIGCYYKYLYPVISRKYWSYLFQ
jgi:hypothetical protein